MENKTPIIWSNIEIEIKELKAYEKNPRRLTSKQRLDLTESLKKFDLVEVPVINKDKTIIAGHQRVSVLKEMHGDEHKIYVRFPNRQLTEEELEEYLIRSNKNIGDWDWDLLRENFNKEDLIEWGFDEEDFTQEVALLPKPQENMEESSEEEEVIICPKCGYKFS